MDDAAGLLIPVIFLAITIFYIYVGWRVFTKADQPGWASIIPIYNLVVMLRIVGRPTWWILLFLVIPVGWLILPFDLASSFGKGTGFGLGLLLLGPIFYPILALGDANYQGPSAAGDAVAATT